MEIYSAYFLIATVSKLFNDLEYIGSSFRKQRYMRVRNLKLT